MKAICKMQEKASFWESNPSPHFVKLCFRSALHPCEIFFRYNTPENFGHLQTRVTSIRRLQRERGRHRKRGKDDSLLSQSLTPATPPPPPPHSSKKRLQTDPRERGGSHAAQTPSPTNKSSCQPPTASAEGMWPETKDLQQMPNADVLSTS